MRSGVGETDMAATLEVTCLRKFVRSLPKGLDTWIGPEGARLSCRQRRRLVLARALVAERPWLVLDEPSEGAYWQSASRLAPRGSSPISASRNSFTMLLYA